MRVSTCAYRFQSIERSTRGSDTGLVAILANASTEHKNHRILNHHHTGGITPKHVTRGEVHLRGLEPGKHCD